MTERAGRRGSALRLLAGAGGLLALLMASPASGAEGDTPVERFNHAIDLADDAKYEEAIRIWMEVAPELPDTHRPVALFNIGRAYSKLGRLAPAWHHVGRYLEARPDDEEAESLRERVERRLQRTHERVRIRCDAKDVRVRFGEAEGTSYPCPLAWWFEPGEHRVFAEHVREPGEPRSFTFEIDADDARRELWIRLRRRDGGSESANGSNAASGTGAASPPGSVSTRSRRARVNANAGWGVLGAGLAVVAGGGGVHAAAASERESIAELDDPARYQNAYDDRVRPRKIGAATLYAAGGACIVAGLVVGLIGEEPADETAALDGSVRPWATRSGGGLSWRAAF